MKLFKVLSVLTAMMLLISALGVASASAAAPAPSMEVRQASKGSSLAPHTGAFTQWVPGTGNTKELPPGSRDSKGPSGKPNLGANRSLSLGKSGPNGAAANSSALLSADPKLKTSFDGLNLFQQRYARGGNQFSTEPPDQGLCAGNGFVVETVNDVLNVYNTSGQSVLPANPVGGAVDLNSFYGFPPEIDRTVNPTVYGPAVTDPSCVYDSASQRFYGVALVLEVYATGPDAGYDTGTNWIFLSVSNTNDPTKGWTHYYLDVTNDGSRNPDPSNQCPCIGDYPHLGMDANGVYVTTNAYPWYGPGFNGAQIYAFSKAGLLNNTSPSFPVVHIDTWNAVEANSDAGGDQPGFTVWPAQAPSGVNNTANGGTEYFVSSNAADEATHPLSGTGGTYTSSKLVLWTLQNTAALNTPQPLKIKLSNKLVSVNPYSLPPMAIQKGTGSLATNATPLGACLNDMNTKLNAGIFGPGAKGCWQIFLDSKPTVKELISPLDSNDTRIQQVSYTNGSLWTALDTGMAPSGSSVPRAGIEWFMLNPATAKVTNQGYLGAVGMDFTYPAIAVTTAGKGIIAFTATGDNAFPGAAYATMDGTNGVTGWAYAKTGVAAYDGDSGYYNLGYFRPRWGDYGAAAVDGGNIWFASEYVSAACDFKTWGGTNFDKGTGLPYRCGGTRSAYGNWATRVSMYQP